MEDDEKRYVIEISGRSLKLLKQAQEKTQEALKQKVSYDKIIALALDKPTILLMKKEGERQKKKRYESVFGQDIGEIGKLGGRW